MKEKFLVLVGDEDTGAWTVAVDSFDKSDAYDEYSELKTDGTPAIFIATGDFITI